MVITAESIWEFGASVSRNLTVAGLPEVAVPPSIYAIFVTGSATAARLPGVWGVPLGSLPPLELPPPMELPPPPPQDARASKQAVNIRTFFIIRLPLLGLHCIEILKTLHDSAGFGLEHSLISLKG